MFKLTESALRECRAAETLESHGKPRSDTEISEIREIVKMTGNFAYVLSRYGRKSTVITKMVCRMPLFHGNGMLFPKDLQNLRIRYVPESWGTAGHEMWEHVGGAKRESLPAASRDALVIKDAKVVKDQYRYLKPLELPEELIEKGKFPPRFGIQICGESGEKLELFSDGSFMATGADGKPIVKIGKITEIDTEPSAELEALYRSINATVEINPATGGITIKQQPKEKAMSFKLEISTKTIINGESVDGMSNQGLLSLHEKATNQYKHLKSLSNPLAEKEAERLKAQIEKLEKVMADRANPEDTFITKGAVERMIEDKLTN